MGTNSRLIVVRLVLVVVISYSSLSVVEDSFEFGICYYYGTVRTINHMITDMESLKQSDKFSNQPGSPALKL